ncbi:Olfactory receptor 51E1 [Heterocephalus glaber]|uniref:Olfactory receptor n=1 Tax=Heterocephalus glaber TaxID=10181 RepID=G5BS26_HETGA|nr:olfactory receptor 51I1 [Heterocephalus glaber]EHB12087.1 Olfactory receptor 51E1 [Heterocephalus glaber]
MSEFNTTVFQPSLFILTGLRGLVGSRLWLGPLLSLMYIITMVGNCIVIYLVRTERSLQEPQYHFLSMLAGADIVLSVSTLLSVLKVFIFGVYEIAFDSCLTQLFFIHTSSSTGSGILLAMAFDRFVAISNPLKYTTILTSSRVTKMGLAALLRGMALMTPLPILLKQLPFCKGQTLSYSYCLHPNVMKLACGQVKINILYGLVLVIFSFGVDFLFIAISYVLIFQAVLGIASREGQMKALNTCLSHIFIVFIYYGPLLAITVMHRISLRSSPVAHAVLGNIYLFMPPMLNPIVYSLKTKQIHAALRKSCKIQRR